jgi:hypothetical protein
VRRNVCKMHHALPLHYLSQRAQTHWPPRD